VTRQHSFLVNPAQAFNAPLKASCCSSIGYLGGENEINWTPGSGVSCTAPGFIVFIEAAQRIRCYSCVKRAIGAAENIDMPFAFQSHGCIAGL